VVKDSLHSRTDWEEEQKWRNRG